MLQAGGYGTVHDLQQPAALLTVTFMPDCPRLAETRQRPLPDNCSPPAGDDDDAAQLRSLSAQIIECQGWIADTWHSIKIYEQQLERNQQPTDADRLWRNLEQLHEDKRSFVGRITQLQADKMKLLRRGESLVSDVTGLAAKPWSAKGCMFCRRGWALLRSCCV
jgi:hypothetical protein